MERQLTQQEHRETRIMVTIRVMAGQLTQQEHRSCL